MAAVDPAAQGDPAAQLEPVAQADPQGTPPSGQGASPATGTQLTVLIVALLIFYAAPVLIATGNWIARSTSARKSVFDSTLIVTELILQMAQNKKEYLGLFHQLIVPVLAAFTAFGFKEVRQRATWIFVVPLTLLFLAITLSTSFKFLTDLDEDKVKQISELFVEIAQNLSVYVLMLFGLEGAYRRN
ncbi:MAG TPA: hypothetical protein VEK73_15990 [Xanthobacteraceae bacterium]|nr:hypothetical protein [Xanthobacteraceae bacterium]